MPRNLLVVLPVLTLSLREEIQAMADQKGFAVRFCENDQQAAPYLRDAEVILGQSACLSQNAPNLRWICSPSAGVNQFLPENAFLNPSALLTNSSGAYGVTIAEHIVMVTLEMMRRQMEYDVIVKNREWVRDLKVRSIHGSRTTLIGTGNIGQEAARRLRGFQPEAIVGMNRSGKNPEGLFDRVILEKELDSVLPCTDLLVLSLPATKETQGIMDERRLSLLPRNAYVVNVGRGSALDERALEKMLREGRLAGAALDVFWQEPLPPNSTLWDCPRLLITPHIAGNMTLDYTVDRIIRQFLEDFENYCANRPLGHLVDRTVGY